MKFNLEQITKMKKPYVDYIKDIADQLKYQNQMQQQAYDNTIPHYAKGKISSVISPWYNIVPNSIGLAASLGQYFLAKNQGIHTPDIYVGNPYELRGLEILSGNKLNQYPIMRQLADIERRGNYNINRSGGTTGSLKYLANVANTLNTLRLTADMLTQFQEKNNSYKQQYAQALLSTGAQRAQQRQAANQYNEEYAARAHGARQQGMQMGIRNAMDYLNNYSSNEFKRMMGNRMYSLYDQQLSNELKKLALMAGMNPFETPSTKVEYVTPVHSVYIPEVDNSIKVPKRAKPTKWAPWN